MHRLHRKVMDQARPLVARLWGRLAVNGLLTLLALILGACASLSPLGKAVGVNAGSGVFEVVQKQQAYTAHYANSDCAVLSARWPAFGTQLAPQFIDGQFLDPAGFAYWEYLNLHVPAGPHRVVVCLGTAGLQSQSYVAVQVELLARHKYHFSLADQARGRLLQLWEDVGPGKSPLLLKEYRDPPEAEGIGNAIRLFDLAAGSALVQGHSPRRYNSEGDEFVWLEAIDGKRINHNAYPPGLFPQRMVPAGTHRISLSVQKANLLPGLSTRTLPDFEAEFLPRHSYCITAARVGSHTVVRLWDETAGADARVLAKETTF